MRSLIPVTHPAAFPSFMRATSKAKAILLLSSVAVLLAGGAAEVRGQSALDGFDPDVGGGGLLVVLVQADGKILIGGDFPSVLGVARNNIARLNPDGTLDTAFNPNANSFVNSIVVQADGKILAGGNFNGAVARVRQARAFGSRITEVDALLITKQKAAKIWNDLSSRPFRRSGATPIIMENVYDTLLTTV